MNKLTLNFLIAYADVHNLQDKPVADVIEETLDFLNSDEFMKDFLEHYCLMKHYQLDYEDSLSFDFESYDRLMLLVCEEEDYNLFIEEREADLIQSLHEEYMWYKYEDYMLWKKNCGIE